MHPLNYGGVKRSEGCRSPLKTHSVASGIMPFHGLTATGLLHSKNGVDIKIKRRLAGTDSAQRAPIDLPDIPHQSCSGDMG